MLFSAKLTLIMSCIFGAICLGVAGTGFWSLSDISDATNAADAKGFAWFWAFLAAVGFGFGALSWWMWRSEIKKERA